MSAISAPPAAPATLSSLLLASLLLASLLRTSRPLSSLLLSSLLLASLLLACGSPTPQNSAPSATTDPDAPADAAPVSLGRPAEPGDAGPPALPPKVVKPEVLIAQRTAGSDDIEPDAAERTLIDKAGKPVVTVVKICLSASGAVSRLQLLKHSGYPAYDDKVLRTMRTWTFKPVTVDGQALDVCTARTFVYRPSAQSPISPAPPAAP